MPYNIFRIPARIFGGSFQMSTRFSLIVALVFCFLVFSAKTGAQNGHGAPTQTRLLAHTDR